MKSYKIKIKYDQDGIGKATLHQNSITLPTGSFELTTGIVRQRARRRALKCAVPDGIYFIDSQIVQGEKISITLKRDGLRTLYKISNQSPGGVKDGILIDDLAFYTKIALILNKKYTIEVYVNTQYEKEPEKKKRWWEKLFK